jgi:hypothetical protein
MKTDYKILSKVKCSVCKRPLKQNLIDRVPTAKKCYTCTIIEKKGKNTPQIYLDRQRNYILEYNPEKLNGKYIYFGN